MADSAKRRALVVIALAALAAWLAVTYQQRREAGGFSGTLEADEARLGARAGGRVVAVLAGEGDALEAGQPIARLEAAELKARRDLVAAELAEMEAGPREQEIKAARARWDALEAERAYAETDARRTRELAERNVISQTELDLAESRARSLERQAEAARDEFELLEAGTRKERIAQARARLAEIESLLDEMTIRTPSASVLEVLHVRPGDILAPNAPAATVILEGEPWLRVYVPASRLGDIDRGAAAEVRADALPGRTFRGTVEQVGRRPEFTPRNVQTEGERVKQVYPVKIRVSDPDGALRAGMTAEARFGAGAGR